MYHEFILDLKAVRKRSGLSQEDCAHLIGTSADIFGRIERGERQPSIEEICALQLLFGKTFESFYAACIDGARHRLEENLRTLPLLSAGEGDGPVRDGFLRSLGTRLKGHHGGYGG